MRIAVLGSGAVGAGLAGAAVAAGHDVVLTAARPDRARRAAVATGARAVAGNAEAVVGADLVVLAVPHGAVADVVAGLGDLTGAVVVDATNPLDAAATDLTTRGTSAGEALQRRLPGARVVKAFNTVFASRYAEPLEDGAPIDALIAGDDAAAKRAVAAFAGSLGLRAVDVGGLRLARALEEMALLNIRLNAAGGLPFRSAWRLVGPVTAP